MGKTKQQARTTAEFDAEYSRNGTVEFVSQGKSMSGTREGVRDIMAVAHSGVRQMTINIRFRECTFQIMVYVFYFSSGSTAIVLKPIVRI